MTVTSSAATPSSAIIRATRPSTWAATPKSIPLCNASTVFLAITERGRLLAAESPQAQVYQGDAAAVIAAWPERRYSLVHIDVDLYQPMIECLDYFGPRLAEGGIIIADDYETPTCPGVAQAVHEYLARAPVFQVWRMQAEQVVLIKR